MAMASPAKMFSGKLATILCCMCGIEIEQNPANMCISCVREHIDITEGINRQLTIHSCRNCGRFLCPPWQTVKLESKELLAACLRKIPGLSKVKLIDAVWIWTEPHSMRLKIKITIQKEVMNGAVLQQAALVEFTIRNQQCNHCQLSFAQGAWQAVVQVRQRVTHKRTFFFLEQLLLKHHAHSECINIVTFRDGMDFYFAEKQNALRFIDFLTSHIPVQTKYSRKLLTADHSSNTAKFKHNFIVQIAPVCKDDLVVLPKDLSRNLSNISPLVLVKGVSAGIHVVDPLTGERQEINCEKYWRHEFTAAMSSRQFVRFVVLSVEPVLATARPSAKQRGTDRKLRLAECVVAREKDFGVCDTQFTCTTHLGHLLREGDIVLGYDLTTASWANEAGAADFQKGDLPDVVLVRKVYTKSRVWELRSLEVDDNQRAALSSKEMEAMDEDYEQFLQELEGDKELRGKVNLYKASKKATSSSTAGNDEREKVGESNEDLDEEEIRIEELLDDLALSFGEIDAAPEGERVLLSGDEAASIQALPLETTGFDVADFDSKKFNFI